MPDSKIKELVETKAVLLDTGTVLNDAEEQGFRCGCNRPALLAEWEQGLNGGK